jgi:hypothetical protein
MPTQFSAHRPVVMGIEWMITADHPLAARAGAARCYWRQPGDDRGSTAYVRSWRRLVCLDLYGRRIQI